MRGGYRLSGWGGLGWVWVWGGFLWVMVACGSEESGPGLRHHWVLGGPTRRALFGRLERFGPKVKRPGLRLLGRAEWGFFSSACFSLALSGMRQWGPHRKKG